LLFPILTFLAPDAFSNWYRLGTGELWGTACLAGSLLCAALARRNLGPMWDGGVILLAFLAGLSKETFVATLPALAWFRAGALQATTNSAPPTPADSSARTRTCVWTLLIAFLVESAVVLGLSIATGSRTEGGGAFAGASLVTTGRLQTSLFAVLLLGGAWIPLLLLLGIHSTQPRGQRGPWELVAFGVLWVTPQVIIYFDRGGPLRHFALPASIGIGLVLSAAITQLRAERLPVLLMRIWLYIWTGLAMLHAIKAAQIERAVTVAHASMVRDLAAGVPKHRAIALAVRPSEIERAASLVTFLGLAGRSDVPVYYIRQSEIEAPADPGREWLLRAEPTLHRQLQTGFFRGRTESDIESARLEGVVFHETILRIPLKWRRSLAGWRPVAWCADYMAGDIQRGRPVILRATCYNALLRPQSAVVVNSHHD
jgi:hypothetical protein